MIKICGMFFVHVCVIKNNVIMLQHDVKEYMHILWPHFEKLMAHGISLPSIETKIMILGISW